jgi:hypothetical protein
LWLHFSLCAELRRFNHEAVGWRMYWYIRYASRRQLTAGGSEFAFYVWANVKSLEGLFPFTMLL